MKISLPVFSNLKVVLVVLFTIALQQNSSGQEKFKVMTYNIYHGENPTKPGESNLKDIADLIRKVTARFGSSAGG